MPRPKKPRTIGCLPKASCFKPNGIPAHNLPNVVHLRGAALRLTGYRVFDIFTALGRFGLGRLSIKRMDKSPRRLFRRFGVLPGDTALLITFS